MKVTIPSYYQNFKCIAGACKDSCCIGWEIDIDPAALKQYRAESGSFGKRLQTSIDWKSEPPHFLLKEDGCCPFLNQDHLCDLILTLGEDSLCDICTNHPRFFAWYGNQKEAGLGLCCEAAAELIFRDPAPAQFQVLATEEPTTEETISPALLKVLLSARETGFALLQNRSFSIFERLALLLSFGSDLQDCFDLNSLASMESLSGEYRSLPFLTNLLAEFRSEPQPQEAVLRLWNELLACFASLEPNDPNWRSDLKSLSIEQLWKEKDSFLRFYQNRIYEYEHLSVYIIYRYFLHGVFENDLLFGIKLAISALCLIFLTDLALWKQKQEFTFEDRVFNAKRFSKEIEYSPENLDTLSSFFWEQDLFSFSSLLSLLLD